jgi:DNA helicase HerA-like ATPase
MNLFETIIVNMLNRISQAGKKKLANGLLLGTLVLNEQKTKTPYFLPSEKLKQHIVVEGVTGYGKTRLLCGVAQQQVDANRGMIVFDLHDDVVDPILRYIVATKSYSPDRVILIDPTDREWAVGLNPLSAHDDYTRFREAAELTRTLADRWDFKGARTEELLRNSIFVLSACGLTLLEIAPLLSNADFRAECLKKVTNSEVLEYFELRFDRLSDAMQGTMRESVLNKLSEFTADPHFRYILGQRVSTFSFDDALAKGKIILLKLSKGQLGVHAPTFGTLMMNCLKSAIFRRQKRDLYTVFADEMQNLASGSTDFETWFSEARKFGVGIITANQYSAQLPPSLRSATKAIGTRIFFRLSPEDAAQIAQEIGGGKAQMERLRNLPPRHAMVRTGNNPVREIVTPNVETLSVSIDEFVAQSNAIYARRRSDIDADILSRRPKTETSKEAIHDWE